MLKRVLIIAVCAMVAGFASAQSKNELKGPKAKNYKPWQNERAATEVYSTPDDADIKGPTAKNNRFTGAADESETTVAAVNTEHKRFNNLQGPNAKNRRYFASNQEKVLDDSVASTKKNKKE